jgi:hypothetical protein
MQTTEKRNCTKAKLSHITLEVLNLPNHSGYFKEAKNNIIYYYEKQQEKLLEVSWEQLERFNYLQQVDNEADKLEKQKYINILIKNSIGIEKHIFAPEINKLLISSLNRNLKGGYINTPNCATNVEVFNFLLRKSKVQLINLCLEYGCTIL